MTEHANVMLYLGEQHDCPRFDDWIVSSVELSDIEDSLFGATLYLDLSPKTQDETLARLHNHPMGWSTQIFVKRSSPLSPFLSDGEFEPENYRSHHPKLALISSKPSDRLLAYLWLVKGRRLSVLRDTADKSLYHFPLLQIYHNSERTPFKYLLKLENNLLLESTEFKDRVRHCKSCESGYLNYVDTCPSCRSVDIKTFDALHCFTCGHVDDAAQFTKSASMSCPKCSTHLKHIGVDYDRPLEMLSCNECASEFAEPVVVASCLSCDTKAAPENLQVRNYKNYKLGENAQKYLLDGDSAFVSHLNLSTAVEPHVFEAILDWKNKLSNRHEHKDLLVGIKILHVEQFIESEGEIAFIEFMSKFSEQLEVAFRTTDVSCQYEEDLIMILLPHFDENHLLRVEERMSNIAELIDSPYLELSVKLWGLPVTDLNQVKLWLKNKSSELNA